MRGLAAVAYVSFACSKAASVEGFEVSDTDKVLPSTSRLTMKDFVKQFLDVNDDGIVEKVEFNTWLEEIRERGHARSLKARFDEYDHDQDNMWNTMEFHEFMHGANETAFGDLLRFQMFDFDMDGSIAFWELYQMVQMRDHQPYAESETDYVIEKFDFDKDGKLNFSEFRNVTEGLLLKDDSPYLQQGSDVEAMFASIDQNSDGFVEPGESEDYLVKIRTEGLELASGFWEDLWGSSKQNRTTGEIFKDKTLLLNWKNSPLTDFTRFLNDTDGYVVPAPPAYEDESGEDASYVEDTISEEMVQLFQEAAESNAAESNEL